MSEMKINNANEASDYCLSISRRCCNGRSIAPKSTRSEPYSRVHQPKPCYFGTRRALSAFHSFLYWITFLNYASVKPSTRAARSRALVRINDSLSVQTAFGRIEINAAPRFSKNRFCMLNASRSVVSFCSQVSNDAPCQNCRKCVNS